MVYEINKVYIGHYYIIQTATLNELNCFCFRHIINILLTELSRSVWENLDLGSGVQTSLRSVCTYDLSQDSPMQTSCSVNKS